MCDLVEEKRPPGIMCVLDDVCAQLHSQGDGADGKFLEKMQSTVGTHQHLSSWSRGFTIVHYAGQVRRTVHATHLCFKMSRFYFRLSSLRSRGARCVSGSRKVEYEVEGFCERNRDVLFPDIIVLMQSSSVYVVAIYPFLSF